MSNRLLQSPINRTVVEAYRLDRYDNPIRCSYSRSSRVVEAYRWDRYDNAEEASKAFAKDVVEAYLLDRYDNSCLKQKSPHCF